MRDAVYADGAGSDRAEPALVYSGGFAAKGLLIREYLPGERVKY